MKFDYDLLIIGGGINGSGIARDAAGRGLSVCLVEQADLASGTSSASSKMIHGGLRYLEYYEFALVRQALRERETLLRIAPHLISPLRIVLPVLPDMRPKWMIRIGLWLYDHLGGKISLPATSTIKLEHSKYGLPLAPGPTQAFAYSDGWVDDARLVILNALDAKRHGASIQTQTKVNGLEQKEDGWQIRLQSAGVTRQCTARCVINAAGPWADMVDEMANTYHARHMLKVQGSHIVLRKLYEGDHAYLFQHTDGRVLFAIPFQDDFTLFGTTDTPISSDPGTAHLTEQETEYLLKGIEQFFAIKRTKNDIVWSFSGVRALFGDPKKKASALSRDYELVMDPPGETPPLLSVLGGKITTYRSLSEKAVNMVCSRLSTTRCEPWTANSALPGGDFGAKDFDQLVGRILADWPFLEQNNATRLAHAYGTMCFQIFENVSCEEQLGIHFGSGFYELEAEYLIKNEWAVTVDDILWRRTKMGLRFSQKQVEALEQWIENR